MQKTVGQEVFFTIKDTSTIMRNPLPEYVGRGYA